MKPFFRTFGTSLETYEQAAAMQQQRMSYYAAQATPQQAQAIGSAASQYPHVGPGSLVAMEDSGYLEDEEIVQEVSKQSAKPKEEGGGFFEKIGNAVGDVAGAAANVIDFVVPEKVEDAVGTAASETAEALQPVSRTAQMIGQAGPELIQSAWRTNKVTGAIAAAAPFVGGAIGAVGGFFGGGPFGVVAGGTAGAAAGTAFGASIGATGEAIEGKNTSTLGLALQKKLAGEEVDTGSGYFVSPESDLYKEQKKRVRAEGLISGTDLSHTIGRDIMNLIGPSEGTAFNLLSGLIDGAIAVKADPLDKGLRASSALRQINKSLVATKGGRSFGKLLDEATTLEEVKAGLVRGRDVTENTTLGRDKALEWLVNDGASELTHIYDNVDDLLGTYKWYKKKVPIKLLKTIKDKKAAGEINSELDVAKELYPHLGFEVNEKFTGGLFPTVRRAWQNSAIAKQLRIGQTLPGPRVEGIQGGDNVLKDPFYVVDANDADARVGGIVAALENAKVPQEEINRIAELAVDVDNFSDLHPFMKNEVFPAMKKRLVGIKTTHRKVRGQGSFGSLKVEQAHEITGHEADVMLKMFANDLEDVRTYAMDIVKKGGHVFSREAPNGAPIGSPHRELDLLNNAYILPDFRNIRRTVSSFNRVLDLPGVKQSVTTADFLQNQIWKRAVLLRGAYTLRVIGEEFTRRTMDGTAAPGENLLGHIAWTLGEKTPSTTRTGVVMRKGAQALEKTFDAIEHNRVAQLLGIGTGPRTAMGKGEGDILGELFGGTSSKLPPMGAKEQEQFKQALVSQYVALAGRSADPAQMVREIQRVRPTDTGFVDVWGENLIEELLDPTQSRVVAGGVLDTDKLSDAAIAAGATGRDATKDWIIKGDGNFIRHRLAKHKHFTEGPNGSIFDDEVAARWVDELYDGHDYLTRKNVDLEEILRTRKIDGKDIARLSKNGKYEPTKEFKQYLSNLLDSGQAPPEVLGIRKYAPTSGSPASEVGQSLDKAARFMFSALNTRPTNYLNRSVVFRQNYWKHVEEKFSFLRKEDRAAILSEARNNKLDDVVTRLERRLDDTAGRADVTLKEMDQVAKNLALDDTRNLLFDLTERSQFFDVARVIFPFGDAWKEIMTRWSKIAYQHPEALRRGQRTIEGGRESGFFHVDKQTNQLVYAVPGSEWLNKHLTGVPAGFQAPVAGLNMFSSSVLPGIGPVMQTAVAKAIPNKPDFDWMRKQMLPYGGPKGEGGILESFAPAFVQKIITASKNPESDATFMGTVNDVANYKASTGKYDLQDPTDVARLERDSIKAARKMYLVRSFAQFTLPSAPSWLFKPADSDEFDRLPTAYAMVEEYRKLEEKDWTTATQKFLARFGEDALLYTQGKTKGIAYPTDKLHDWVRENPDLVKTYPDIYMMFAPQGGKFSITEAERQKLTGEREVLSLKERSDMVNNRVASMLFYNAKDQIGDEPTEEQRIWLGQYREQLLKEYPGYNPYPEIGKTQETIAALEQAMENPRVRETEAGKALSIYIQARNQALQSAYDSGLSSGFQSAESAQPIREWLIEGGRAIANQYPDFQNMWERVFQRELI